MEKKHFCFFQTAETGNQTPNSSVKGSGANHYPRAPAQHENTADVYSLAKINWNGLEIWREKLLDVHVYIICMRHVFL